MSNLMVLAAGRRRYVLDELLKYRPTASTLWSCDVDALTPGMTISGVEPFLQPNSSTVKWLPDFCETHNIDAVLSLHDFQTLEVSAIRPELQLAGTTWVGPSHETAKLLLDKYLLAQFLEPYDMAIPTFCDGESLSSETEWIVKDRWGSASSGLRTGLSREQAGRAIHGSHLVAQPRQFGEEWNVDFFVHPGGMIQGFSAKRKLRMRAGETDAAEVFPARQVPFDVDQLLYAFRGLDHLGNVDVDIFVTKYGHVRIIDVNPRFGGGYAFSLRAGYRAAEGVWSLAANQVFAGPIQAERYFRGAKSFEILPV